LRCLQWVCPTRESHAWSSSYRRRWARALEGSQKWIPAEEIPETALAEARTTPVVVAEVVVDTDQETTFRAFTDPDTYSRWLGARVTITDNRFAATMEWGTEVRGLYEIVPAPEFIAMRWDFDDDNVRVPGGELIGYLRFRPAPKRGAHVAVHQLVDDHAQARFMETAWGLVLGRLRAGVVAASDPSTSARPGARRTKRRHTA
jgi:uncharacterized protein YndB with AHSA1/START domain